MTLLPMARSRIDNVSLKKIQDGTELVTNGTFDTDSDWTLSTGWSITGGEAVASSAAQYRGISSTTLSLVAGRRYRASMDVASYTAGSVDMRYREGGSIIANTGDKSATGTFTLDFTCTDAASPDINIQTRSSGSNTFDIDNVSVRELYPFEQFNNTDGTFVLDAAGFDVPNQTVMQVDQGAVNTPPYLRFSILDTVSARIFATISSSAANSLTVQ